MILGFEFTLFCYLCLAAVFGLLRRVSDRAAMLTLVLANITLLYIANWVLLALLCAQVAFAAALYVVLSSQRVPKKTSEKWAWAAFAGLVPVSAGKWIGLESVTALAYAERISMEGVFWSLGASFFVIKSFVALREALASGRPELLPLLANMTFLPSFAAGPICSSSVWSADQRMALSAGTLWASFLRIGWGAAAFYVIAPRLQRFGAIAAGHPYGWIADVYLSFAALYFDFSGYTEMAIATAALFGVRLPENFNRPYLATSVQDFWRRWHISLSTFLSQYLYRPIVRRTGSVTRGLLAAYLFAGLWHEISIAYLFWGAAHGIALRLSVAGLPAPWAAAAQRIAPHVVTALNWFATVTFVALISYVVRRGSQWM